MIPQRDLYAAGPHLFARLPVERIQHRVCRSRDPALRLPADRQFAAVYGISRIRKLRSWDAGRRLHPPLFRILPTAVSEHDSIGNHWRLRHLHVTRNPRRPERKLAARLYNLERGNGAICYGTVFDGVFVLWMLRSPKRSQNPAGPGGIFPTRHGAPHTGRKVDFFIAEQGSAIKRRAMILAAKIFRIEQPDTAFLA